MNIQQSPISSRLPAIPKRWQRKENNLLVLICIYFFLTSCSPIRPIEFRSIDNFKVSQFSILPEVRADVKLFNPNSVGAKIKELKFTVNMGEVEVAKIALDETERAKAHGEFTLPMTGQLSLKDLSKLVPVGLGIIKNKAEIPVILKFDFTVKKFIFKKHFHFEVNEKINPSKIKL